MSEVLEGWSQWERSMRQWWPPWPCGLLWVCNDEKLMSSGKGKGFSGSRALWYKHLNSEILKCGCWASSIQPSHLGQIPPSVAQEDRPARMGPLETSLYSWLVGMGWRQPSLHVVGRSLTWSFWRPWARLRVRQRYHPLPRCKDFTLRVTCFP